MVGAVPRLVVGTDLDFLLDLPVPCGVDLVAILAALAPGGVSTVYAVRGAVAFLVSLAGLVELT